MKPWHFVWLLSAPVLTGVLITVLLLIPSLAPALGMWIVVAAVASMVVALPFSLVVGKAFQ
jgi:hypothetical protein